MHVFHVTTRTFFLFFHCSHSLQVMTQMTSLHRPSKTTKPSLSIIYQCCYITTSFSTNTLSKHSHSIRNRCDKVPGAQWITDQCDSLCPDPLCPNMVLHNDCYLTITLGSNMTKHIVLYLLLKYFIQ